MKYLDKLHSDKTADTEPSPNLPKIAHIPNPNLFHFVVIVLELLSHTELWGGGILNGVPKIAKHRVKNANFRKMTKIAPIKRFLEVKNPKNCSCPPPTIRYGRV